MLAGRVEWIQIGRHQMSLNVRVESLLISWNESVYTSDTFIIITPNTIVQLHVQQIARD